MRELEHGVPPAALDAVGRAVGRARRRRRRSSSGDPRVRWPLRRGSRPAASALQAARRRGRIARGRTCARRCPGRDSSRSGDSRDRTRSPSSCSPTTSCILGARRCSSAETSLTCRSSSAAAVSRSVPSSVPGATPCLSCVAEHRRDADEAWPRLAAQLLGRRGRRSPRLWRGRQALAASHMLTDAARHPARQTASSLQIHAESGARTTKTHRPHAACRCRSLGGIATGRVHEVPATTRATAYAQPA